MRCSVVLTADGMMDESVRCWAVLGGAARGGAVSDDGRHEAAMCEAAQCSDER